MRRKKPENEVVSVSCAGCGFGRNIKLSDCVQTTTWSPEEKRDVSKEYTYFCPECKDRIFYKEVKL